MLPPSGLLWIDRWPVFTYCTFKLWPQCEILCAHHQPLLRPLLFLNLPETRRPTEEVCLWQRAKKTKKKTRWVATTSLVEEKNNRKTQQKGRRVRKVKGENRIVKLRAWRQTLSHCVFHWIPTWMVEEQLPAKTTANYSNKPNAIFFSAVYTT